MIDSLVAGRVGAFDVQSVSKQIVQLEQNLFLGRKLKQFILLMNMEVCAIIYIK